MMLRRFLAPGKSPLSLPWGILVGMIDRLQRIEDIKPAVGFVEFVEEQYEDYWSR